MAESDAAEVGAVLLAAGSSSRMGTPKQLLRFRGESLLRRAARAALEAGCRPVIVVTGAHADESRGELRGLDVREVVNTLWDTGMASSIRAGVLTLLETNNAASALVLMLCDQPFVTRETIARLVAARRATGCPVVASRYGAGFGVPALFDSSLFKELSRLEGRAGAKPLIERHASEAHFVHFPEGEIDVDTPDDFARLTSTSAGQ